MNVDISLRRRTMDEADEYYQLAGQLLGTTWVMPDDTVVTVKKARQSQEHIQGERTTHPEVVLSNEKRLPVSGFAARINPREYGDIEPSGNIARKIVEELQNE